MAPPEVPHPLPGSQGEPWLQEPFVGGDGEGAVEGGQSIVQTRWLEPSHVQLTKQPDPSYVSGVPAEVTAHTQAMFCWQTSPCMQPAQPSEPGPAPAPVVELDPPLAFTTLVVVTDAVKPGSPPPIPAAVLDPPAAPSIAPPLDDPDAPPPRTAFDAPAAACVAPAQIPQLVPFDDPPPTSLAPPDPRSPDAVESAEGPEITSRRPPQPATTIERAAKVKGTALRHASVVSVENFMTASDPPRPTRTASRRNMPSHTMAMAAALVQGGLRERGPRRSDGLVPCGREVRGLPATRAGRATGIRGPTSRGGTHWPTREAAAPIEG
jgi:hypothetical protein